MRVSSHNACLFPFSCLPRNFFVHVPITILNKAGNPMKRRRQNDLHKLDVYRCSLSLYRKVSRMVTQFPRGEADLRDQMKRAARSVPFNIGEGAFKRDNARAAAFQIALGEDKELIVALDCVEIDSLAPLDDIIEAQDLADRIAAMLTKLIATTRSSANSVNRRLSKTVTVD